MKAIVYNDYGGPDVLELREIAPPNMGSSDVLIDVHYTSVNPIDWKIRQGRYASILKFEFPVVPGWDVAGIVADTGASVTKFSAGDRVYGMTVSDPLGTGTYAEQTLGREAVLALAPQSISLRDAAAVPLVATSAHDALFRLGEVATGQRVLIHQGSGGVGCMAIQLAKAAGAFVYSTCGTANVDYVSGFGADRVIDYTQEDFVEVINDAEPNGIDFVLEGVGGENFQKSHQIVKQGGALVTMADPPDATLAETKGIRSVFLDATPNGALLLEITQKIDRGEIKLPHITELPLAEAAEAHIRSQAGHVRGKIVLNCGGN
jgi:NADPH:quinone reductase-like Zn-dependent oxidoreductase